MESEKANSNPFLWRRPPVVLGYAIAVLSVAFALLIGRLPALHLQAAPLSLFLSAVMFSAWFGGVRPGLLAISLSVLAFDYFILPPINSLTVAAEELPRLVMFTLAAFFVGMLSAAQRSAAESLRHARDELEVTVQELKRINEALRTSESNLRLLVEAIPGMVYINSPDGELEYVNQRMLDYTGKTLDDMATFGWTDILHPDDGDHVLSSWRQSVESGIPHEAEFRHRRSDGTYRWFQSRIEPLRDNDGSIIRWYGLLHDIDDRKNTEDALRKSQGELAHLTRVMTMGELAASIAHEIKQPLAAVVTNGGVCLRWLASDPANLDEAREAARRIIRDGNRANDVITRIRALLLKAETQKAPLDINEAIQEVTQLTKSEAARKGVAQCLELSAGLSPVFGDRVQLQQVILNLLMNGIEAMATVNDRPRDLLITSRPNATGEVHVAVKDRGTGIEPANLENIFDAFYTTKSQGLGMGLAISRSIIEAHGGRLWATPNEDGGATIQFTLPLVSRSE